MRLAAYAVAAAAVASSTQALPQMLTYRGKSPYVAVHEEFTGLVSVPNPNDNPTVYAHHESDEYALQGFHAHRGERPAWAQRGMDRLGAYIARLEGVAAAVGVDLYALSQAVSPYWNGRGRSTFTATLAGETGASRSGSRFTFNPEGDADFDKTREGQTLYGFSNGSYAPQLPSLPKDSGFDYRKDKVRGVNLGNWLVAEFWMSDEYSTALNSHAINSPRPNPIVDEWTAGLYSDPKWAEYVMKKHYDTWITEDDFRAIRDAGLNHVRIPYPYWGFAEAKGPAAPYFTWNQYTKLIQAVGWAKKYGLKVWVDLHCVPGSQNGFDNSGRAGPINWANNPDYYTRTQYAFTRLVNTFAQKQWNGVVTAIEPVNEPQAQQNRNVEGLIRKYYPWARDAVAHVDGKPEFTPTLLAMHDGFLGPAYWENFFQGTQANRVLLDVHLYYVYAPEQKNMKDTGRLRQVCNDQAKLVRSQGFYPTIVGEMAPNGPNGDRAQDRDLPVGPVKFPPGPAYPYSVKYMAFMARNFRTQQYVYEKAGGWIFWAWRNDKAKDWSYKTGMQFGWIPKDGNGLSNNPYGDGICNI